MSSINTRTIRKSVVIPAGDTLTGHTLFVERVDREDMPASIRTAEYSTFYIVRNFDKDGVIFFYLAKGYRHPSPEYANDRKAHDPTEWVAWYRNRQMYHGRGDSATEVLYNAMKYGWQYAQ